ncbi:MAG TPA: hypothetical protein ENK08_05570 [Chloroflexi bacterium]|nr:hypothetical protein [Chloroflexota bacterium]
MNKDLVDTAFSIIREEIGAVVEKLNERGGQAFREGKYDEVEELRKIAEDLMTFCAEVERLRAEWVSHFDVVVRTGFAVRRPAEGAVRVAPGSEEVLVGEGDRKFLEEARRQIPARYELARELLFEVRRLFDGDLEAHPGRRFVEAPVNFWAVQIQPRKKRLRVFIHGGPENYNTDVFRLKRFMNSYTEFFLESEDQVAEAIRLIKEAAARKKVESRSRGAVSGRGTGKHS